MKLLLDQNLSPRLEQKLQSHGVQCDQVRSINLEDASDTAIWQYAKKYSYTVVTSDSDFSDLAIVKGIPPRIILLRYGNTSTEGHFSKLIEFKKQIEEFVKSQDESERIFIIR